MHMFVGLVQPQSASVYWYVVRSSGFVLYLLLTAAVALGLLLSLKWRSHAWPRVITEEMHRFITLFAGIFLVLHVVSTLLDSFVHFTISQVLVPFTADYRVVWFSLGIISMYLGIALAGSIYLRPYVGYHVWRTFHYAGFFAWILALAHSVATGTDTQARWATVIYIGSGLLVVCMLFVRFGGIPAPLGQPPTYRPRVVAAIGIAAALAAALAALGPLRPGWASVAGAIKPQRSTARSVGLRLPSSSFQDTVLGTSSTQNSDSQQQGTILLHMALSGRGSYRVSMSYGLLLADSVGGPQFIRGVFSLAPTDLSWNCSGSVTYQPPDSLASTCRLPSNQVLQLVTRFNIDQSGNVSGSLSGTPTDSGSSSSRAPNG